MGAAGILAWHPQHSIEVIVVDLSELTHAQLAALSDLDGNGKVDFGGFRQFHTDCNFLNGAGALAAMLVAAPEPSSRGIRYLTEIFIAAILRGGDVASRYNVRS